MKLHKVALWRQRQMYYILNSKYVLDMALSGIGLRVSYLDSEKKLLDRLKKCNLLQK